MPDAHQDSIYKKLLDVRVRTDMSLRPTKHLKNTFTDFSGREQPLRDTSDDPLTSVRSQSGNHSKGKPQQNGMEPQKATAAVNSQLWDLYQYHSDSCCSYVGPG